MSAPVKFWRYALPAEKLEGWAVVFIDDRGTFSSVSAFGSYGYVWTHHGCRDVREFIAQIAREDDDYVTRKLSAGRKVYRSERTLQIVKERIIAERREGSLSKRQARVEWDLLEDFGDLDTEADFGAWQEATRLTDTMDCSSYGTPEDVVAFCKKVLPRLAAVLRAELAAEGYFTEGATS